MKPNSSHNPQLRLASYLSARSARKSTVPTVLSDCGAFAQVASGMRRDATWGHTFKRALAGVTALAGAAILASCAGTSDRLATIPSPAPSQRVDPDPFTAQCEASQYLSKHTNMRLVLWGAAPAGDLRELARATRNAIRWTSATECVVLVNVIAPPTGATSCGSLEPGNAVIVLNRQTATEFVWDTTPDDNECVCYVHPPGSSRAPSWLRPGGTP